MAARPRLLHPSRARVARWLETGEPPELVAHIETCSRCASRVEELARPEVDIASALAAALAPPDDLRPRLSQRLDAALRERAQLALLGELFGIPWQAARFLGEGETP